MNNPIPALILAKRFLCPRKVGSALIRRSTQISADEISPKRVERK